MTGRPRREQLDLLAWTPPAPPAPARSYLPPLVASYDPHGRSVAWLARCWGTSFAHGAELVDVMLAPPFTPRSAADIDVMLHALVDAGWLLPPGPATPTAQQSHLYIQHGGAVCGGGRKELMRQDASALAYPWASFREIRFCGFEPNRACEPYRQLVLADMAETAR